MENAGKAPTKKITSVPLDESAGKARARQADSLQECGEIASARLCLALPDALTGAADQLRAKSAGGTGCVDQRLWQEAADFARNRPRDLVDSFRKHFERRYSQSRLRKSALMTGHVLNFDVRRLQIVEHEVLDNGLDTAAIIEAIRNSSWGPLHELTKWFRETLADPELSLNDMPLGPRLIGGAITDAVNDQFGGQEIKRLVLRALCRTLPEPVDRIYRDLAGHLAITESAPEQDRKIDHGLIAMDRRTPGPTPDKLPDRQRADATFSPTDDIDVAGDIEMGEAMGKAIGNESNAGSSAADRAVDQYLARKRLPRFIADFLNGPWRAWLAVIDREYGPSSPEWDAAINTMRGLARSLRLRRAPDDRARLMGDLPDLVKQLGRGLEALNEPIESRHRFFARLAECHVRVMGASRPVPLPSMRSPTPPAQAAREQTQQEQTSADSLLEDLEAGIWLEFREPYIAARKLKLAWISPNRNLFFLTNQLGERILSLGPKDLAALLREGGARIISAPDETTTRNASTLAAHTKKSA